MDYHFTSIMCFMTPYHLHKLLESYLVFGLWTSYQRIKIFPICFVTFFFPNHTPRLPHGAWLVLVTAISDSLENQELDME